ncbi:MAG: TolC family protein [Arcobacter sp.]|nr:TolC family protein [Arcobacter sp.]
MYLKKSSYLFVFIIFFSPFSLYSKDQNILSSEKLNLLKYNNITNKEEYEILKKSWLNQINLSISKNFTDNYDTLQSSIKINQPIFRSGGLYNAIKYANINFKYNELNIEIQKKELIKTATKLLFQLHITDLNIQKNKLLLKNANINILRKKEQVLNGFLDTSYLNNAILDASKVKLLIVETEHLKDELSNNFLTIASGNYNDFELPILKLTNEKNFIKRNLNLAKAKADIDQKKYFKNITIAKYLPSINVNFDYTKFHDTDNNPMLEADNSNKNYGISLTMPIDFSTFNDIESEKINYLKSKLNLKNKLLEEQNFYKTKLSKIKMLNKKKQIVKEDYETYDALIKIIEEEKKAELKTQSDIDTLLNTQQIKFIEHKIYSLEEQIELFEIYSKIN